MTRQTIITKIRTMKQSGRSNKIIATLLNLDEIPTLSGRGEWSQGSVFNLCQKYRLNIN